MNEASLSVRALVRSFKSGESTIEVLRGVSFDLRPGEVVGLVGPSGSGKSSLLHACGLLEKPTSGEVWIGGVEAWGLSDGERTALRRRTLGFVYQFHYLLPEFDARDNVALPQLISGKSRRDAQAEAARLLEALGMGHRLTHRPGQLSGGEQQRVAIARALSNKPKVLLADEPTGNLDPETSGGVFDGLFTLARQEGVAALIATHNLELAGRMDRVLALRGGRLEERAPGAVAAA